MAKEKKKDDLELSVSESKDENVEKKGFLAHRKRLIIAGGIVLCLALSAAGFMMFGRGESQEKKAAVTEKTPPGKTAGAAPDSAAVFTHVFSLDPFEITQGEPGQEKLFKARIKLELERPELALEIRDRKEMIQGAVRSVLAGQTLADLGSAEAKISLKIKLLAELNRRLETGKVRNVYFNEFLIF